MPLHLRSEDLIPAKQTDDLAHSDKTSTSKNLQPSGSNKLKINLQKPDTIFLIIAPSFGTQFPDLNIFIERLIQKFSPFFGILLFHNPLKKFLIEMT